MLRLLRCSAAAFLLASALAGCASPGEEDATEGAQNLTSAATPAAVETVRAYYAATTKADPAAALDAIVADDAILAAPSVKILKGVDQLTGKKTFIGAVAGNAFILKNAKVRDVVARDANLVVARIDLPLPNGDTITQVEFFELEDGKISRLDSYYDTTRFIASLPAVLLEKVKMALGL